MSFNPRPLFNLRVIQQSGRFLVQQAAIVPEAGRTYPDALIDSPDDPGEEIWIDLDSYADLTACVVDIFGLMLEQNQQTRDIDVSGLPSAYVQRTLDLLDQVTI